MQICILGSGILGVTTAYFLEQRGHRVTIIDRQPHSAMETSFANGGQLSYSHAEPWATPSVLPKVLKWLFQENAPLAFKARFDPEMIAWGIKFLGQCTHEKALRNATRTLRLALYSKLALHEILAETPVEFDLLKKGVLHIFTQQSLLDGALRQAAFQETLGCGFENLTPAQCLEKEPALARIEKQLLGGVFHDIDESGDIFKFTQGLAAKLQRTEFHYLTEIRSLRRDGAKIVAVETSKGRIEADAFVVAMGSYSPKILKPLGIKSDIYPMKGYSLSVPINGKTAPHVSITDQGSKIVYSRLGNILRAAGTAEFAGHDHEITPKRIAHLKAEMQRLFGDCGDFSASTGWACLRPQTPAGTPLLGKTPYTNLYLNTGHGTLGWTLGPGSAKIVADTIEGKPPEIDLEGLRYE